MGYDFPDPGEVISVPDALASEAFASATTEVVLEELGSPTQYQDEESELGGVASGTSGKSCDARVLFFAEGTSALMTPDTTITAIMIATIFVLGVMAAELKSELIFVLSYPHQLMPTKNMRQSSPAGGAATPDSRGIHLI